MLLSGMTGEMTDKQKQFMRSILNNGENLLNLINDILDLTKIEAGKLELYLEPVELRAVLVSVLSTVKPRARDKMIEISTFLPTDLPPLRADAAKLGQILLNLLTNAIKYTPERGSVSIEARPKEGFVEMRVTDTGIGIAPETSGAHLRALHPDRQHVHPQPGRHRPGPRHHQGPDRTARRHHPGPVAAGQGFELRVHHPAGDQPTDAQRLGESRCRVSGYAPTRPHASQHRYSKRRPSWRTSW